jgi:exopolysaccharide biosynthesis polyprenyl glycosylphosphotransferase
MDTAPRDVRSLQYVVGWIERKALMQRVIARPVTREMAILRLAEVGLSCAVIYTVVRLAGNAAALPDFIHAVRYDSVARAAVLSFVTGSAGAALGLYRADGGFDHTRFIAATGLATCIAFVILLVFFGNTDSGVAAMGALFIAKTSSVWFATLILIRLAYRHAGGQARPAHRVLLVGDPREIAAFSARLRSRGRRRFTAVVLDPEDFCLPRLRAKRIWGIVIASGPEGSALRPLMDCKLRGMRVLSAATFHEHYLGRIDLDLLTGNDLLLGRGYVAGQTAAAFRRLSELGLGIVMLLLTLPVMAVTALAIKIDSRGPVLYRQQRLGLFDKPFTLFKFRSMTTDAEAGGPRWAQQRDPRITRVGRFIRSTRIDELPQLVNVICGDMSLVGPRPERPHFVEQLTDAIPFYRQRAYVKPGVTGWAQINFPYGASIEDAREKLAYDLYYVKNRSLLFDALILISTFRVVLSRQGAR